MRRVRVSSTPTCASGSRHPAGRQLRRHPALGHRAGRAAGPLPRRRRLRRRDVRAAGRLRRHAASAAPVHRQPGCQRRGVRPAERHGGPEPDRAADHRPGAGRRAVRGVAVDGVAGTIAIDGKNLRIVAADGSLGGGRVVAADAGGPFLVSAPSLPVRALRGAGCRCRPARWRCSGSPICAVPGRVRRRGRASDGVAAGYPVSGAADLSSTIEGAVRSGMAALGATYGAFSGAVDGVGSRDGLRSQRQRAAGRRRRGAAGAAGCRCARSRAASRPTCGCAAAEPAARRRRRARPEGSYNGLAFRDARAHRRLGRLGGRARRHRHRRLDPRPGRRPRSPAAPSRRRARRQTPTWPTSTTTSTRPRRWPGRGRVAFALANDGRRTRTSGRVDVRDLRFRRFPFGTTDANWSQRGGAVDRRAGGEQPARRAARRRQRRPGRRRRAGGLPQRQLPGRRRRAGDRPGHLAAAVRAERADPGPGRCARQPGGPLPAAGRQWPTRPCGCGSVYGYAVQSAHAHASGDGARIALSDTSADLGFAQFAASGSFGLAPRDPLALAVHAQAADVRKALARIAPKAQYDIAGALQADARISGTFAAPRAALGCVGQRRALRLAGDPAHPGQRRLRRPLARGARRRGHLGPRAVRSLTGSLPISLQPPGLRSRAPLSFTLAPERVWTWPRSRRSPRPRRPSWAERSTAGSQSKARARRHGWWATSALTGGLYVSGFDRAVDQPRQRDAGVRRHQRRAAGPARQPRWRLAGRQRPARPAFHRRAGARATRST